MTNIVSIILSVLLVGQLFSTVKAYTYNKLNSVEYIPLLDKDEHVVFPKGNTV